MKMEIIIGSAAILLALIFLPKKSKGGSTASDIEPDIDSDISELSFLNRTDLPRGIRNNNPGNIEQANNDWLGKVPLELNTDSRFEQFFTYVHGVRAMIKLIRDSYISRNGLNTIEDIIYRYAPGHENDTEAYIIGVAASSGIGRSERLTPSNREQMFRLISAMAFHENGRDAITQLHFNYAWSIS